MKRPEYIKPDFTKGPYPEPQTIDGEKTPPEGTAYPKKDGALFSGHAIGTSIPPEEERGPFVQHVGEGLHPSFSLEFENKIPFIAGNVHSHTGLLLFALALNMRPKVIIETGTSYGYSTMFLAKVCELWGAGKVYTFDVNDDVAPEIRENVHVECIQENVITGLPKLLKEVEWVDFVFIDAWKKLALFEFSLLESHIPDGGIVAFHDTQALNTGRTLYRYVEKKCRTYDAMLFDGVCSKDNPHDFYGNADDRGLYVLRKRMGNVFLGFPDSGTEYVGDLLVMPKNSDGPPFVYDRIKE